MKFQGHLDEGFYHRITMEAADYRHARSYLSELKTGLRTLDAIHVAIVERHGLELLTSDRVQADGAEYFGISVQRVGIMKET